jgi:hypothetical protein
VSVEYIDPKHPEVIKAIKLICQAFNDNRIKHMYGYVAITVMKNTMEEVEGISSTIVGNIKEAEDVH